MGIVPDEPRLMDSVLPALKRRPIIIGQFRAILQDSDPSWLGIVEMPVVRVVTIHIGRPHDGMLNRANGGKRGATVLVGTQPNPRSCNYHKSDAKNCNGACC